LDWLDSSSWKVLYQPFTIPAEEREEMRNMIDRLICLFIGIVFGIPLGWVLLVLVAILAGKKDDGPPSKDDWYGML
jgi:hypothetical protein